MAGGKIGDETTRAAVDPNNKMIINQIMLKYRPIAPRPVTAERSGCLVPSKEKRSKRKYVRVKKKITINDNNNNITNGGEFVVTGPVEKISELISFDVSENNRVESITRSTPPVVDVHELDLTMAMNRGHVVESWITMESVTKTFEDVSFFKYTDKEIWKDLEIESSPGFISNKGYDKVQWVNEAYRRMVDLSPQGGSPPPKVFVWLGVNMEKTSMVEFWSAFSCRVRVVYQYMEKKKQMTVPCDVWKMDSGGYAWRLDVKAALSLGRLN